ncbi:hypothetical protein [Nocardia sp. NPDC051832]|uniref:hypothetical protein n=1 Tax=Nocardia sp. NPDC051832 TaxID=3155673 RepID=UPI003435B550
MGSRTTKGYAVPEDHNPLKLSDDLVFPWGAASTVVTTAQELGIPLVKEAVDTIHAMLGNPGEVAKVVQAWQETVKELTKAIDGSDDGKSLATAKEELGARWNGGARETAVLYVDRIITATKETRGVVEDIANKIDSFRSAIIDNYKSAIQAISKCAQILVTLGGGLAKATFEITEGKIPVGDYVEKGTKAIAEFMAVADKVATDIIDYRNKLLENLSVILTSAAKIEVPGEMAASAGDENAWVPRYPTGPAVGTVPAK